jgi:sRNA-binding regulator protein Hfq
MMLAFRHSGVSQRALPPLLAVRSIPLQQPTTTFAIAQPLQAPCTSPETEDLTNIMANPSVLSSLSSSTETKAAPAHKTVHEVPAVIPSGPRKLVRPPISKAAAQRRTHGKQDAVLLSHKALADHAMASAGHDSSHAEAFYFQKQVQTQTLMCFVLEDGEKLEGYIEWYDRNSIKVRHAGRTLIYKASIKYLYKAGENLR